jgi:hypothetical protein
LDKENPPPFEVAKVIEMLKNVKSLSDLGKWVSGLVSPIFSSAIIDATDYVNPNAVRQITSGAISGSVQSGATTFGLASSNLITASPSNIGGAFLLGGIAGSLTGGSNYLFKIGLAAPTVIVNEAGWIFYTSGTPSQDQK